MLKFKHMVKHLDEAKLYGVKKIVTLTSQLVERVQYANVRVDVREYRK